MESNRKRHGNIRHRLTKRSRRKRFYRHCLCLTIIGIILVLSAAIVIIPGHGRTGKKTNSSVSARGNTVPETEKNDKESKQESSSAKITLTEAHVTLKLGDTFQEPGYSASDKSGTDLTSQVIVDTSALNHAGTQKVIYTVSDSRGMETHAEREVEVQPNLDYPASGLPICMYHCVYDRNNPPADLNANYIASDSLAEEMKYLQDNGYYYPSWREVRDYLEGKLILPEKSIVITFDDGPSLMEAGIPILTQYQVQATSFVIAGWYESRDALYAYKTDYLTFESHSYDMHKAGGNIGHGGIYTAMSREEVLEDLKKSFEICGNHDAFAYPFGDYTNEGCSTLEEAGLLCAVTTEYGKCYPGDNPMLLPRIRMQGEQSLDSFIAAIQ